MGSAERDREFVAFVAARSSALLRTAYFVTADEAAARELLVTSLAKTRLAWGRTGPDLSVETYVRQTMFRTYVSDSRGAPSTPPTPPSAGPAGDGPGIHLDASAPQPSEADQARARLWAAWRGLAAKERAVLVLGIQDELTDEEVARTLGSTLKTVRSQGTDGYVALRQATKLDVQSLSRELRAAFAASSADVRPDLELADDASARAVALGRQRRVKVGTGVAAVALVVAVAAGASALLGGDPPISGAPSPSGSPTSPSASPSGSSSGPSVAAVPDSVLRFAREAGALVAWGPAIVDGTGDGTGDGAAVVVDIDPANGASRGNQVIAVARAQSGYVVSTRTQAVLGIPSQMLSYLGRDGSATELGRISDEQSAFAVSPDGLSVVHVIAGPVQGENPVAAGESELVVQDLSGNVVNRVVVPGPVRPISVDAERVWFDRLSDRIEEPYVWERATGTVVQVAVGRRTFAQDVRDNELLVLQVRGDGCIRSIDVADVDAPTEQWRRCAVGFEATFDPTATRVATLSFERGAVLYLLDRRDGSVLDTVDLDAGFAGQFVWTAGGASLVVETVEIDGLISYVEVHTSGPDGGGVLTAETHIIPDGPIVLGTELPLPSVR